MFPKALTSGADMVCIELEDGIAIKDKDQARKNTINALKTLAVNYDVDLVVILNCIKIKNANEHNIIVYNRANCTDIFFDAIGLFFVLSTCISYLLSSTSFTMHPADLISTEPKKKKNNECKICKIMNTKIIS